MRTFGLAAGANMAPHKGGREALHRSIALGSQPYVNNS